SERFRVAVIRASTPSTNTFTARAPAVTKVIKGQVPAAYLAFNALQRSCWLSERNGDSIAAAMTMAIRPEILRMKVSFNNPSFVGIDAQATIGVSYGPRQSGFQPGSFGDHWIWLGPVNDVLRNE